MGTFEIFLVEEVGCYGFAHIARDLEKNS